MTKLRRTVSVILILCIVFSYITSFAVPTESSEAMSLLRIIGIADANSNADINSAKNVTRAELACMVCRTMNFEPTTVDADTVFDDVDINASYYAAIKAVYDFGILRGNGDGTFEPEKNATYFDAIAAIVRLLGYDKTVSGGVDSYISIAAKIGLTGSISGIKYDDDITLGILYALIYNSLSVPMITFSDSYIEGEYAIDYEKTILTEYFYIYSNIGVVKQIDLTSLSRPKTSIDGDCVMIDDRVYQSGASCIEEYLGERVKYYYTSFNNDDPTIVFVSDSLSDSVTFDAYNIRDFKSRTYEVYRNDSYKADRYILDINYNVIYNGKALEYSDDNLMKPALGEVRIIDVDKDGKYDTVFVTSYTSIMVEAIDTQELAIYDKYDSSKSIHLNESADIRIIDEDGYAMEFDKIAANNIVFAAISEDGNAVKLKVGRNSVSGIIESLAEDASKLTVEIDTVSYEFNHEYMLTKPAEIARIRPGDEYTFYLDPNGRIAAFEKLDSDAIKFGYVINGRFKNGINNEIKLKMLTADGEIHIFNVAKNVKIDGTTMRDYEEAFKKISVLLGFDDTIENYKVVRQPICYKLDNAEMISYIDQPYITANSENDGEDSLHQCASVTDAQYKKSSGAFDTKILTNSKTIVFAIPDSDIAEDSKYAAATNAYFANDKKYSVTAYSTKKDWGFADIIITDYVNKTASLGDGMYLVTKAGYVLNGEGDKILKLTMQNKKQTVTRTVIDEDTSLKFDIGEGDVIALATNSVNGFIEDISIIYDRSKDTYSPVSNPYPSYFGGSSRIEYGKVYSISDSVIRVTTADLSQNPENVTTNMYNTNQFTVLLYEARTNKVSVSSGTRDMLSYINAGNDCSTVFVFTTYGDPNTIIIYR